MSKGSQASENGRGAVEWLLASPNVATRLMARVDLADDEVNDDDRASVLEDPRVVRLLSGQKDDGGFGEHPYRKWTGAHWRLVSLVELNVPPEEPRVTAAAETVLQWLCGKKHRSGVRKLEGLTRQCASQEGNALAVASRIGLVNDPRTELLAESLKEWQWPDGGWNCDLHASGRRSSFHESLAPAWGLHEYAAAAGDREAARSARRAAELFLDHRVFRSKRTGEAIRKTWTYLHYPPYWHYDILQALLVLSRMGLARDPRTGEALDVLEKRRLPDGRWRPSGYFWNPPGSRRAPEVVDWGRGEPNEMITLNALRVLRAGGRLN